MSPDLWKWHIRSDPGSYNGTDSINKTGSHRKHQPRCNHVFSDHRVKKTGKPAAQALLRHTVNGTVHHCHENHKNYLRNTHLHLPAGVYFFFRKNPAFEIHPFSLIYLCYIIYFICELCFNIT